MRKLYEINEELASIEAQLEESGGEISEALERAWDKIGAERDEKLANYCGYYKNLDAQYKSFDSEAKRLAAIAKSYKAQRDSLKEFLAGQLKEGESFGNGVHKLSWRKSERVEILDPLGVHESFRVPQPDKILKDDIKRAIKEGADIPFAQIVEHQNMQIK